jgi:hypothetical protein
MTNSDLGPSVGSATHADLDDLATELFRTFARFEYSLKAAGFHDGLWRRESQLASICRIDRR